MSQRTERASYKAETLPGRNSATYGQVRLFMDYTAILGGTRMLTRMGAIYSGGGAMLLSLHPPDLIPAIDVQSCSGGLPHWASRSHRARALRPAGLEAAERRPAKVDARCLFPPSNPPPSCNACPFPCPLTPPLHAPALGESARPPLLASAPPCSDRDLLQTHFTFRSPGTSLSLTRQCAGQPDSRHVARHDPPR